MPIIPPRSATPRATVNKRPGVLADNSVLRLNTDTAVTVRYRPAERLIEIDRGQAFFEVAHEPTRRFRVVAGATNIVAVGTQFDVYRDRVSTVVTVVEGQVTVASDSTLASGAARDRRRAGPRHSRDAA